MKKIIRNIWCIISFPILYITVQMVIFILYATISALIYGVIIGFRIVSRGEVVDLAAISEKIIKDMNISLIILVSGLLTLLITFLLLRKKQKLGFIYKFNKISSTPILLSAMLGISMNIFIVGVIALLSLISIFSEYEEIASQLMKGNIFLIIISVGIIIPFVEEVIFRGIVFNRLTNMTKLPIAIVISSFIFGFVHFNVLQGLYTFLLGVVLALIYYWCDSIYPAIIVHISFNLTSVIVSTLFKDTDVSILIYSIITVTSFIISVTIIYVLWKRKPVSIQIDESDIILESH